MGPAAGEISEDGSENDTDMKVFNTSFTLSTDERCEVSDITKLIRAAIQQFPLMN